MTLNNKSYWRMAASQDGLDRGYLSLLGIPDPPLFTYQAYAEQLQTSSGDIKRYGHPSYVLRWRQMEVSAAYELQRIVNDVITANGWLYMTVDRADAVAAGRDWVDIRGKPQMSELAAVAGSRGRAFEEISVQLSKVEIVSVPSKVFDPVLYYSLNFTKNHNSGYLPLF